MFHKHKSFGPELYGLPRLCDQSEQPRPFSPKAIKEKLEKKYPTKDINKIAKAKAKRNVKKGIQQSMWSFVTISGDDSDGDNILDSDKDKKPPAKRK